jgi:hypothetical protein
LFAQIKQFSTLQIINDTILLHLASPELPLELLVLLLFDTMADSPGAKDTRSTVDAIHLENAAPRLESRAEPHAHGTVQLLQGGSVVLIPTPSPDPKGEFPVLCSVLLGEGRGGEVFSSLQNSLTRIDAETDLFVRWIDPLNLPKWHKFLIIFIVASYSATSVLCTSGLGSVFPSVLKEYAPSEATKATDLLTYPTLFMAIGNLLSMPLSVTIGRRPVFLASLILLVISGFWCAFPGSLDSHIAGRNFYSIAAGQSEALAPYIIEEIHFLHERSAKLSWFIGLQTVMDAGMFVATTYIVPAWGTKWWYLIITFLNAAILILSIPFLVETKYDRPEDADSKFELKYICVAASGPRRH